MRVGLHQLPRGLSGTARDTQLSFDQVGTPLSQVVFVVVDLETTGGSPQSGACITEIGAVKVQAGQVLGEFHTLVNPSEPIPPFITLLTGITHQMVAGAPTIEAVLPSFLEFAHGSVLVAHNAGFDIGFLKAHAARLDLTWPRFRVLDTVPLARSVLHREEVRNHKLATLAAYFRSEVSPNHRALTDARATVDVLHGLIERVGNRGVQTFEELREFTSKVKDAQRSKRHLAAGLPEAPGVYVFRDTAGKPLYVGTSTNLRSRVRSYFTSSETRSRMGEMITLAARVEGIVCATATEAAIRELRLIHRHKPPYNKRSKFPERSVYLTLTDEPWPRLSIVRDRGPRSALGPFGSRRAAQSAADALLAAIPLRQCTDRLPRVSTLTPCVLAELASCTSPCDGRAAADHYASLCAEMAAALQGGVGPAAGLLMHQMEASAHAERFEAAAATRDRLLALVQTAARSERLQALSALPEVVATQRNSRGQWEVHVVRYGRLCAAGVIPPGAHAQAYVDALLGTAETLSPDPVAAAASTEETALLAGWLEREGTRLISIEGVWQWRADSAARWLTRLAATSAPRATPQRRVLARLGS